jgi:multiple sugar transport system permease protein
MSASTIPESSSARQAARARRALGLARALMIYGLLIGGSLVFSLPFLWMIGTSFKVDREMFSERITLLPLAPIPAGRSPFLDRRYFPEPRTEDFAALRPLLEEALRATDLGLPPETDRREDAASILAPGVYQRLRDMLPAAAWSLPAAERAALVAARITPDLAAEVASKALRQFSLGAVRVRSLDVQEIDATAGRPISAFWTVSGAGPARLVDRDVAQNAQADLVYDVTEPGRQQVRLEAAVDLDFAADRLHRLQLFLRPDDSWHLLEFELEKNGRLYRALRPEPLANFQWSVVTLQEYGPDDQSDSSKIRLWIPYRAVDEGPSYESDPRRIKVRVTMRENSAAGAWWAKCKRNYRGALNYIPFWRYTATSVFLVVLNIIGNLFSCSLVAFAFARLEWPGRNFSFGLMLATMMIPPQVTMIPYFLIIKHLGWYNTLKPLWVVSFFGNAFNIFLLRQFMRGIPRDLEDAARIDGCNFLQVYWYMILPLIKPTLACIAIFTFMGVWNDFMGPLIYLSDQRLYPLSLGLYAFNVQAGGDYGMMMAGSLLMTVPVIVIFFFAQKYFIQGVTLTGMKG